MYAEISLGYAKHLERRTMSYSSFKFPSQTTDYERSVSLTGSVLSGFKPRGRSSIIFLHAKNSEYFYAQKMSNSIHNDSGFTNDCSSWLLNFCHILGAKKKKQQLIPPRKMMMLQYTTAYVNIDGAYAKLATERTTSYSLFETFFNPCFFLLLYSNRVLKARMGNLVNMV